MMSSAAVRALSLSRSIMPVGDADPLDSAFGRYYLGLVIDHATLIEGRPDLVAAVRPLLEARNAVEQQVSDLDRKVMKLVRRDAQVRRFMTGRQPLTLRHGLRDR